MSKVKIQGNASGTGVVTLTAPNTNTDRTITLPDGDITLGGGVDGIVSTATSTAIAIDASGNVGIGTTSPASPLHVFTSTGGAQDLLTLSSGYNNPSGQQAIAWKDNAGNTLGKIGVEYSAASGGALTFGSLYSGGSTTTERMRIDSAGRVTKPYQPAFWVKTSGTQTGYIPNGFSSLVAWDVANSNVGNHFSTSTGLFTAPVGGLYSFHATGYADSSVLVQSWLVVNGSRAYGTDVVSIVGHIITASFQIYLAASDTVAVKFYGPSATAVNIHSSHHHTWFKGHLIG